MDMDRDNKRDTDKDKDKDKDRDYLIKKRLIWAKGGLSLKIERNSADMLFSHLQLD